MIKKSPKSYYSARMTKYVPLALYLLLAACAVPPSQPAPEIADTPARIDWISVLVDRLPPLSHDRGSRWPMILWDGPDLTKLSVESVKTLLHRGVVPSLRPEASMVPFAQVIQAAGGPVILMAGKSGAWGYGNPPRLAPAVISGWKTAGRNLRTTLQAFRDAGVTVDALWLDYEVAPFGLSYTAISRDPVARRHIPRVALTSPQAFARWRRQLGTALMSAYVAGPAREVFPGISVSNWMTVYSTKARPVPGMIAGFLSPTDPGLFTATNPVAYGTDAGFWRNGGALEQDQDEVDRRYMMLLLGQVSADAANRAENAPHLDSVPWVGRWVPITQVPQSRAGGLGVQVEPNEAGLRIVGVRPESPAVQAGLRPGDRIVAVDGKPLTHLPFEAAVEHVRGRPGDPARLKIRRDKNDLNVLAVRIRIDGGPPPLMSRERYREALRHLWLRGIDGMQVFNSTTPGHTEFAIAEVEDAQGVYSEMLAFSRFLDNGVPMNLATFSASDTLLWSGLRLGNEAIIRAVSLSRFSESLTLHPWPGTTVTLSVGGDGQTWHLHRDSRTGLISKQVIEMTCASTATQCSK